MIFSELYSAYYNTVAQILKRAVEHPLKKDEIRKIIENYAFEESVLNIEPALMEGRWQLLRPDGTTVIKKKPDMPLTVLQKRWLKAISLDPRIRLFQDEQTNYEEESWKNIEPLFTPDDYDIFDKYLDGDDYTDEAYIRKFRLILDAIEHSYPLCIETYNHKGKVIQATLLPEYLEYSGKDDKFRVIGLGQTAGEIFNLGRIITCEKYNGNEAGTFMQSRKRRKRSVVFEVIDERNALERALLHFAHFEKQTERLGDNRYRITVKYDKEDTTEMVIRVLAFGPRMKVVAPEHFKNLIKERLVKQKSCGL